MKLFYTSVFVLLLVVIGVQADTATSEDYPLDHCIVSGMKLGSMGDPYVHEHEGRTILFCCAGCVSAFEANPDEHLKKLDEAIIEKQKADYPLTTCVVMGVTLGKHGPILDVVHEDRLVRLCCQGCVSEFEKDPDRYIKKLDRAVKDAESESPARKHDAKPGHCGHDHGHQCH